MVTEGLPSVYGAAVAAAATPQAAAAVTELVIRAGGGAADAIVEAMRSAPAAPFDRLEPGDRVALALVRLGGLTARQVAEVTGEDPRQVCARLSAALRALADEQAAA